MNSKSARGKEDVWKFYVGRSLRISEHLYPCTGVRIATTITGKRMISGREVLQAVE